MKEMNDYKVVSSYEPKGDQPQAIRQLTKRITTGDKFTTLLGVTGSGKTYTIAKAIESLDRTRPVLVLSHNKTLAGQLYQEFTEFFQDNAVEYFISYYDYYQPEAYLPAYDKLIEKDTSINEEIELYRNRATRSLIERSDVIVVASVSCIYGLGSPEFYKKMGVQLSLGQTISREDVIRQLVEIQYKRNQMNIERGQFRARGDLLEVHTSYDDNIIRISFFGNKIEKIQIVDLLHGKLIENKKNLHIFPAKHYVMPEDQLEKGIERIREELEDRIGFFEKKGKVLEAQRLKQRTEYDLETLKQLGYCSGIENYSAPLEGRKRGEPPSTLIDFFGDDWLLVIDESHVTIPQIRGMYKGDYSRKKNLVDYGFRLPSAFDNRPLKFQEFMKKIDQAIFVSATPTEYEKNISNTVVEQLIRPTGLVDPEIKVHPTKNQIDHLVGEIKEVVKNKGRVLVTTLTKKLSEHLDDYFRDEANIKSRYLHSDIDTLERNELIRDLRKGEFDVLVGINLLREGLDLPEVQLVAILDADKEGFLRNETSLIQTMGRAARNVNGRVILYADEITRSMKAAIDETNRRRRIQQDFNKKHDIIPTSIQKGIREGAVSQKKTSQPEEQLKVDDIQDLENLILDLKAAMRRAAEELEFEKAAKLRDRIKALNEEKKAQLS